MVPLRMSVSCRTNSRGAPGALLLFTSRTPIMLKRQRSEQMAWSWTAGEYEWISPSQKDLTPQHLEFTWDGPRIVEVVPVDLKAIHVTMIADMTVDTTDRYIAMIAMTTGNITDHTDGDLRHHTTEEHTGRGQGPGLLLPVDIDDFWLAKISSLPKDRQETLQ